MFSAFVCSTYAAHAENSGESERLFGLGIEAGRSFFRAALDKEITEDEIRNNVPVIVLLHSEGPTVDFKLGRIFEASSRRAYDDLTGRDTLGIPLHPKDKITDKTIIKLKAESEYDKGNCAFLR